MITHAQRGSAHLTVANHDLQRLIEQTPIGMMHWAGSGPEGATCFGCAQFDQRKLVGKQERENPQTVHGACKKWLEWMNANTADGYLGRRVFDPLTPACSHFVKKDVGS